MTEVLEMVSEAMKAPFKKEDCPFCRPEESVSEKNELTAKHDEDDEDEMANNNVANHSGTLGKNLKNYPQSPRGNVPEIPPGETAPILDMELARAEGREWHQWIYESGLIPVLYSAHHLIPGNDGLKASDLYQKYKTDYLGPVDDGEDKKNVGYNVNSARNGTWLPGNYAVRPWKGIDPEFQKAYAFLAIKDTTRQFHDSHKVYSKRVEMALNGLTKLLPKLADDGCPVCGSGAKKGEPPYHLNARLNAISSWLRGKVTCNHRMWKKKLVTSEWCNDFKNYMKKKNAEQNLEALRKKPQ